MNPSAPLALRKPYAVLALGIFVGALTLLPPPLFANNELAVKALGGKNMSGKNSHGAAKFDFSRGNHRLRLEDVNIHSQSVGGGKRFYGTFTVTNRIRFGHDPHVFVEFDMEAGNITKLRLEADGGNSWWDVISVDKFSKLASASKSKEISIALLGREIFIGAVKKIGVNGNAQIPMSQAIELIIKYYGQASMGQL
jgi:hypothetical protein